MSKTVNIDIKVQSKSLLDLEKDLEGINEELKQVAVGSNAFDKLSKQSQKATKELQQAQAAAEGFTDDKKFLAADGAIKTMAGSLSGVVGALGLVGVESETFGEMEKKAASAIAVAMGVKDVSEGVMQLANSNVIAAAKAKIMGLTTKQALIATGVGAFVVILGSVIAYWDDITKAVENFGNKVPFVGKAIKAIKTVFSDLAETFRPLLEFLGIMPTLAEEQAQATRMAAETTAKALEKEIDLLKAKGATKEEIFKKEMELLQAQKTATEDQEEIEQLSHEMAVARAAEEKRLIDEKIANEAKLTQEQQAQAQERDKIAKEQQAKVKELADIEKQKATDLANLKKEIREAEANTEAELRQKELEDIQAYYDALILQAQENDIVTDELEASRREVLLERQEQFRLEDEEREAELKALEDEKQQQAFEEKVALLEQERQLELQKRQDKQDTLNNLISIAGAETNVGRLLLITKQGLAAQELIQDVTKTIAFSKQALLRSQAAVAAGTAQTAAVGFPQNVPLLISYAAQAASIIRAVRMATKQSGNAGNFQTPSVGQPNSFPQNSINNTNTQPPQVLTTQPTIRTYVLSGDVTSGQEADSKLNNRRTLD